MFILGLLAGLPVVFSLLIASAIPVLLDSTISLNQIASIILQNLTSFTLLAIPFFIYMGQLLSFTGISDDLIYITKAFIGRMRGALAYINVITSMLFGGISGSSVADVASLGKILIPAMKKNGYSKEFTATLTAASSTLSAIIPPSTLMIVYGALAGTSISALFIAGIVPGVLIGGIQMIYSYFYVVKHGIDKQEKADIQLNQEIQIFSKKKAFVKSIFPASIFFIIIIGILAGIFTPTESAAVAVVYTLVAAYLYYKKRDARDYITASKNAAVDSAAIFIIIAVAGFFSWVLTYYETMTPVIEFVKRTPLSDRGFLLIMTAIYLVIGTFMEPNSAMLIFVPLLLPIMEIINVHPTVAGIVTIMAIRVGTVTPPYGLCTIMAAGLAGTTVVKMMKEIVLFTLLYTVAVIICIFFQDIILFLPRLLIADFK
jgi:tripartite ATP-independent transporter DctM subunit